MKVYIGGGVGEHGRNCFYVSCDGLSFLVDCGLMADDKKNTYPHLIPEQINNLEAVFLTHSHNDHTGAIPWLYENGFDGEIIATTKTLEQINFPLKNKILLEEICPNQVGTYKGLKINWGRAGHTAGSVWYKFSTEDKTLVFSGDYSEHSPIYECDLLRGMAADLAVIDVAYGRVDKNFMEACKEIIEKTKDLLDVHKIIAFPVPKYGRGIELFKILSEEIEDINYYGDENMVMAVEDFKKGGFFYKKAKIKKEIYSYKGEDRGIVFISDPQLKSDAALKTADQILAMGGKIIATGFIEDKTYAKNLLDKGKLEALIYPIHQNYKEYLYLLDKNSFKKSIPYHSDELKTEEKYFNIS